MNESWFLIRDPTEGIRWRSQVSSPRAANLKSSPTKRQ
jgi:hypothetical protein